MSGKQANYEQRFHQALARTRRYGLATPELSLDPTRALACDEQLSRLGDLAGNLIGELPFEAIAGRCAPITEALLEPVHAVFGRRAYFTIGWFRHGDRDLFRMSEREIHTWLQGNVRGKVNIHCWLTLSTMEVIDCTLLTSIGVVTGNADILGRIIAAHGDEAQVEYQPMLIGTELLQRAGWSV